MFEVRWVWPSKNDQLNISATQGQTRSAKLFSTVVGRGSKTDNVSGKRPTKVITSLADTSRNAESYLDVSVSSREDRRRRTGCDASNKTYLLVKERSKLFNVIGTLQRWFAAAPRMRSTACQSKRGFDRCNSTWWRHNSADFSWHKRR